MEMGRPIKYTIALSEEEIKKLKSALREYFMAKK